MGLFSFNDPPTQVITPDEFKKVMNMVRRNHVRIPSTQFARWEAVAIPSLKEGSQYKGMDARELEQYIATLPALTDGIYKSVIPEISELLHKALQKRMFGSMSPI